MKYTTKDIDIDYLEKKLASNEDKTDTISEIEGSLMNIIREQMTDEQFWAWVSTWKDAESIIEEVENWDSETQLETLKDLIK